ncbi:MAG: helix-turn-helix domain-containing protein [Acutalibacteraceae bacterium]|nr:helix-turn-helix domain-containing protein [Acutalibacteraceae bacterium]
MNQEFIVLQYMKDHKGITSMEAFKNLGITRLSAKIFELRRGYDIRDVWEESYNRYGVKVRYKRYIYCGKL